MWYNPAMNLPVSVTFGHITQPQTHGENQVQTADKDRNK